MSKEVDALADVLKSVAEWNESKQATVGQQIEGLQLVVSQMTTALALHEVQIAKLREGLMMLSARRD